MVAVKQTSESITANDLHPSIKDMLDYLHGNNYICQITLNPEKLESLCLDLAVTNNL